MWYKRIARFRQKKENIAHENVSCANCETNFSGNFCPNCGQSVDTYDKPVGFVIYNFLGDFFAFDTRFFRTLIALLFKPGFLSKEYIVGRRVRYAPPFRIFVFVSFVLFLLLQIYTTRGLNTMLDTEFGKGKISLDSASLAAADSVYTDIRSEMDGTDRFVADSVVTKLGTQSGILKSDAIVSMEPGTEPGIEAGELLAGSTNTRQLLNIAEHKLEERLNTEEDPVKRAQLQKFIRICQSPEQANAKILQYLSYAFFLLLPLFALILKLVYIRQRYHYIRHLIFSIHIHAFLFVALIAGVSVLMLFSGGAWLFAFILLLLIPVYFILALKKFYQQSVGKTLAKAVLIGGAYNFLFLTIFSIVLFSAISVF